MGAAKSLTAASVGGECSEHMTGNWTGRLVESGVRWRGERMEHPEIAFGEDGEFVSVWVGQFASEEAVDAYTAEQYDEDRDDEPISPFAADIGLKFYDHDFMEVHFELGLSGKAAGAFAQHSYGDYSEAWAAAQR